MNYIVRSVAFVILFSHVYSDLQRTSSGKFGYLKEALTCGGTTSQNVTYFNNPDYPQPSTSTNVGSCMLTVIPMNNNICQIRLDFIVLSLAQPNPDTGVCEDDLFKVLGGASTVPTICGENAGQHMYIDVDPSGSAIKVIIDADVTVPSDSLFNIRVTQYDCTDAIAPRGCLQYFTSSSGIVQSFNFPATPSTYVPYSRTTQLANQQYAVCVRSASGFCGITWTPSTTAAPYSFILTGDAPVLGHGLLGSLAVAAFDQKCNKDYVTIPGGTYFAANGTTAFASRFCGAGFPSPVQSTFQPFILYYTSNGNEDLQSSGGTPFHNEQGNDGFSLTYRQNLCTLD